MSASQQFSTLRLRGSQQFSKELRKRKPKC
jgi:hypothetical protein